MKNYTLTFQVSVPEGGYGCWVEEETIEHAMECCFYILWGHQFSCDPMECGYAQTPKEELDTTA